MKQKTLIKSIISIGGLLILSARLLWPTLKIDVISLGLIIVAILPWLSSLLESAEFPGGWKIKFRDIQQAGAKITGGSDVTTLPNAKNSSQTKILPHPDVLKMSFSYVLDQDPNLALVGIRIEIEKRMRQLAEIVSINEKQPLSKLLKELKDQDVLSGSVYNGLRDIVTAGNQAAHGARVEPSVMDWAFSTGPAILIAIDRKIEEFKPSK